MNEENAKSANIKVNGNSSKMQKMKISERMRRLQLKIYSQECMKRRECQVCHFALLGKEAEKAEIYRKQLMQRLESMQNNAEINKMQKCKPCRE